MISNMSDDDIKLQNYQDDLDTGFDDVDPITNEETDDPTEELGVPPEEFRDELDKEDFGDGGIGDDDVRETIEDADKDIDDLK
jgi:hypothetical protein